MKEGFLGFLTKWGSVCLTQAVFDLWRSQASHHASSNHLTSRKDFLAFVQDAERLNLHVSNIWLLGNNTHFATAKELGQQ